MLPRTRAVTEAEYSGTARSSFPIFIRERTLDRYVFDEIFNKEQYRIKPDELKKYAALKNTSCAPPKIIFDLGANIGLAAVYFAECYPDASIYSFEPDRENYELMLKNTQGYKNITPVLGAIWDCSTDVHIANRDAIATRSGKLNKASFIVQSGIKEGEEAVPGYTIDQLIEKFGVDTIDVCKIDIQGTEKRIFQGNIDWLSRVTYLFVEVHDRFVDGCFFAVAEAVKRYGFVFIGASGRDGDMLFFAKGAAL